MDNFHVGDRVVFLGEDSCNPSLQVGFMGTVVQADFGSCGVCWDNEIDGHTCSDRCQDKHGWYVLPSSICRAEEAPHDITDTSFEEVLRD